MRKALIYAFGLVMGLLLGFGTVSAVNFTIDLTNAEISAIQWKWDVLDPAHSQYSTAQAFFAAQVRQTIEQWTNQKGVADRGNFCVSFLAANTTARNNACTAIGQPTGCNPCL